MRNGLKFNEILSTCLVTTDCGASYPCACAAVLGVCRIPAAGHADGFGAVLREFVHQTCRENGNNRFSCSLAAVLGNVKGCIAGCHISFQEHWGKVVCRFLRYIPEAVVGSFRRSIVCARGVIKQLVVEVCSLSLASVVSRPTTAGSFSLLYLRVVAARWNVSLEHTSTTLLVGFWAFCDTIKVVISDIPD